MPRPRRPHPHDPHAGRRRHRLLTFIICDASARTPTVATAMPIARFLLLIALPPQRFSRMITSETRFGLVIRPFLAPAHPDEELFFILYWQGPRQAHRGILNNSIFRLLSWGYAPHDTGPISHGRHNQPRNCLNFVSISVVQKRKTECEEILTRSTQPCVTMS